MESIKYLYVIGITIDVGIQELRSFYDENSVLFHYTFYYTFLNFLLFICQVAITAYNLETISLVLRPINY